MAIEVAWPEHAPAGDRQVARVNRPVVRRTVPANERSMWIAISTPAQTETIANGDSTLRSRRSAVDPSLSASAARLTEHSQIIEVNSNL